MIGSTALQAVTTWVRAWLVAVLLAVTVDLILGPGPLYGLAMLSTVGLGVLFACAAGGLFAGLSMLAMRLPRWLKLAPWLLIFALLFGTLALSLGAVANLGTRHHGLAVATIVGCTVGSIGLTIIAALLQGSGRSLRGWIHRRPRWFKACFSLLMLAGALGAVWLDRNMYVYLYPELHFALEGISLYLLAVCAVVVGDVPVLTRRRLALAGVAVLVLGSLPFVIVTDARVDVASSLSKHPFPGALLELARSALDVDRDGFAGVLAGGDCEPYNSAINPGSAEIPGNGVDDNCVGGDAEVLPVHDASASPAVPFRGEPAPLDVVLITIDTLRADRMSAYGAARPTTPKIEAWAANALRFDAAYTSGLWTTISLPSLMYGVFPRRLRWTLLYETNRRTTRSTTPLAKGERVRAKFLLPVDDERQTLAERLRWRGMRTLAVVDDGFTDILRPDWGFGRGFDDYVHVKGSRSKHGDEETADLAIKMLHGQTDAQPFFMWVHFFGPHMPDRKHEGLPTFGDKVEDRYDHEIRFMDEHVGRLLAALEQRKRRVAIVVTSDHGEYIHARGRSHGSNGTNANIQVPLFLKAPGVTSGTSASVASTVDIAPTIFELTETPLPDALDGVDLRSLAGNPERYLRRVVFADSFVVRKRGAERFRFDLASALNRTHKVVRRRIRRRVRFSKVNDEPGDPKHASRKVLNDALSDYLEETGGTPAINR